MGALFAEYWYFWMILLILIGWLSARFSRTNSNIELKPLDSNLHWDSPPDESLTKVYDYVVAFSESSIQWYQSRRRPKRYLGVSLRVSALLATAFAGFIPLSKDLFTIVIEPAWSTVLIASAGVFVSIDVFGGYTSGWVRYMLAQQKIERLRDAFLLDWNALKEAKTKPQGMLERAKAFILAVGKVVDDETQEWATKFQNAIKEMEKARKTAAEIERTGAIEVSVKNPQVVTGWTLEIDGSQRGQTSGKSIAVTDVAVGIRKLRVSGQDHQGKTLSDEKTVKVEGGATATKDCELS